MVQVKDVLVAPGATVVPTGQGLLVMGGPESGTLGAALPIPAGPAKATEAKSSEAAPRQARV
jgi:hypothetical protein